MLVSKVPIEVEVPHEPGNVFEFLRVAWPTLRKARKLASHENLEIARVLGAEFVKAMQDDDPEAEARVRARLEELQYEESNFDAGVLLVDGLVGWSGPDYPDEFTPEAILRLTESTMKWAKQTVIDLTKPADEEEEKNS